MTQSEENVEGTHTQLGSSQYNHTILVSNSIVAKGELFTLTVLSLFLYFVCYRDDIVTVNNFRLIGFCLYALVLARLLARIFWGVKIETILLVKPLGLQTTTVYHSNFKSSKFIPWHLINDVVINEAIVMQKVVFYLAVLVKAGNKDRGESIIPIFIHARPRLAELKKIYTNIQHILRD